MFVDLTLKDSDIKKIFGRTEGDLIHGELDHVIYSTRMMLINIFIQLPDNLKNEIRTDYPRITEQIGFYM